jgi:hypothetical protein
MCMEDIRIGRRTYADEDTLLIVDAGQLLVEANPRRTAITIGNPSAGSIVNVSIKGVPTATSGIPITIGGSITWNIYHHGDIVRRAFFAKFVQAGGGFVSYICSMLDDETGTTDTVEAWDNARKPVG